MVVKFEYRPMQLFKVALAFTAGICLFIAGEVPAVAHHAFAAEYDADLPIDLSGFVTKAKFINPHSWLYLDVKGADGIVKNWGVEFGAPNGLASQGLTRADLKPGTHVRIRGYRAKNGGSYGYSVTVTLDDGRVFKTGGARDAPVAHGLQPSSTGTSD